MNLFDLNEEKVKTVKVSGKNFKIRWMTPKDQVAIAQRRMRLQNGQPISAMTEGDFIFFENIAIVDTCVEELPEGFKDTESCTTWPDIELINQVAHEIRLHTSDIEAKLKKNTPVTGGE
jgi:hypothetical protein